jgi:hypothetical protein
MTLLTGNSVTRRFLDHDFELVLRTCLVSTVDHWYVIGIFSVVTGGGLSSSAAREVFDTRNVIIRQNDLGFSYLVSHTFTVYLRSFRRYKRLFKG